MLISHYTYVIKPLEQCGCPLVGDTVDVEGVRVSVLSLHVGVDVVGGPCQSVQLGRFTIGELNGGQIPLGARQVLVSSNQIVPGLCSTCVSYLGIPVEYACKYVI